MKYVVKIEFEVLTENVPKEDVREFVKEYIYEHLSELVEDDDVELLIKEET